MTQCPKTVITSESETLVEEYLVRRRLGWSTLGELTARQVEAFAILEHAVNKEKSDGERRARNTI